jgi:DNA-binding transcriptional regulator YdaS (Cro superfamily)
VTQAPRPAVPYVRCFVAPLRPQNEGKRHPRPGWRSTRYGERVLVLDTETLSCGKPGQPLLVGAYLVAAWDDRRAAYVVEERGLFLPDDAPPEHRDLVSGYAQQNRLVNLSRNEFARLLINEGYRIGTLVVGVNLPFDLSRIAVKWQRGRKAYRTGFTLYLFNSMAAPRIRVRTTATPRAFIEWSRYRGSRTLEGGRSVFPGRFLDLQRWTYVLTGKKLSLEQACELFGVPYRKREVEYGRLAEQLLTYLLEDVEATWELFLSLREEWNRLPFTPIPSPAPELVPNIPPEEACIDLDPDAVLPHRLQSPAGIAKALLRKLGVQPLLHEHPNVPPELLGIFMSALYGGWGECRILAQRAPVRYLDISSTYLNMARLLGLGEVVAAERIEVTDATEDVRALLERITLDDLYDPQLWPQFRCVCLVEPQGDVLPVLSAFGGNYLLALNPTWSHGCRLWWTFPDLVASKLRTGKPPKVLRALRVSPHGRKPGLRSTRLFGCEISPTDPFSDLLRARTRWKLTALAYKRALARLPKDHPAVARVRKKAQRARRVYASIKAIQEPLAYGIWVEWDDTSEVDAPVRVWAGEVGYRSRMHRLERPGSYCNPLVGIFPPAACRLAVAMMEAEVHRLGGELARISTDAVNIVSTPDGGEVQLAGGAKVHALSYEEIDRIREKFQALAPRGQPFWKLEPENHPPKGCTRDPNLYLFAVSSQRFTLGCRLDDGTWKVRRYSMHGLGSLQLPKRFAEELWREALAKNGKADFSRWANLPVAHRITMSRPDALKRTGKELGLRPFDFALQIPLHDGTGKPVYRTGVCKRDHVTSTGCPTPQDPCPHRNSCPLARPVHAVTRYVDDPHTLHSHPVYDRELGMRLALNWSYSTRGAKLYPTTLAWFARAHLTPNEPRYRPTGAVLQPTPQVLVPHPLTGGPIATGRRQLLIERRGEEWVDREEVERATLQPVEDETLRTLVRDVGPSRVARCSGVHRVHISNWLAGKKKLGPRRRAKVEQALYSLLTQQAQARTVLRSHPKKSELARRLGVDRKTLWRYETGARPIPPDLLPRILGRPSGRHPD